MVSLLHYLFQISLNSVNSFADLSGISGVRTKTISLRALRLGLPRFLRLWCCTCPFNIIIQQGSQRKCSSLRQIYSLWLPCSRETPTSSPQSGLIVSQYISSTYCRYLSQVTREQLKFIDQWNSFWSVPSLRTKNSTCRTQSCGYENKFPKQVIGNKIWEGHSYFYNLILELLCSSSWGHRTT